MLIVLAVIILSAVLLGAVGLLLLKVGDILLLFLLAGLLSFALLPMVDWLERPKLPRPVAVLICYLFLGVVVGGIGTLVLPALLDQSNQLAQRLPGMAQDIQDPNSAVAVALRNRGINLDLAAISSSITSNLQNIGQVVLTDLLSIAKSISTAVVNVILVLVIAFYLLNEAHDMRARLYNLTPPEHQQKVVYFDDTVGRVLGGYLRGQLLVALMVAVLAGVGSQAAGLHYAVVIGTLAGLFELIPFFGPVLSAIPALSIALFQGPLLRVIAILVLFIVIQQIESNIIGPRITGHAVGLHPLMVMFSILVGVEVAGIWGAIFAVPVAGVVVAVVRKIYAINQGTERALDGAA